METLPESLKQLIEEYNKATNNQEVVVQVSVRITEPEKVSQVYYSRRKNRKYQDYHIPTGENYTYKYQYRLTIAHNNNPLGADLLGAHSLLTFNSLNGIEVFLRHQIRMINILTGKKDTT